MKVNLWNTIHGARRRAIDRALLASMEREIAQAEKAAAKPPAIDLTERARIARAFGRPL
jgi:hypothetical protein